MLKKDSQRQPTHPGAILRNDIYPELDMTQTELARHLGISRQTLTQLLAEKRSLSHDMAIRLGKFLGNDPRFWMDLQLTYDLWHAEKKADNQKIIPFDQLSKSA